MSVQKNEVSDVISPIDIRILNYLRREIHWRSVYRIVKGTVYITPNGLQEIPYETIKSHCEKLFKSGLILMRPNPIPGKLPMVKYAYDVRKTKKIWKLIEEQKKLNQRKQAK